MRVLEGVGDSDPDVRHFLARISAWEASRIQRGIPSETEVRLPPSTAAQVATAAASGEQIEKLSAEAVIAHIEQVSTLTAYGSLKFSRWGRVAHETDLERIAGMLDQATNAIQIQLYLGVFAFRPWPGIIPRLLHLASSVNQDVRRRAYQVMSKIADPRIRAFAVSHLKESRDTKAIALLEQNYEQGDHMTIEQILEPPGDAGELHSLCMDVLKVFETNPCVEALNGLLFVYEYTPCSNCRNGAVRCMSRLKTAPDWLIEECRYDSDEETRKRVGR